VKCTPKNARKKQSWWVDDGGLLAASDLGAVAWWASQQASLMEA